MMVFRVELRASANEVNNFTPLIRSLQDEVSSRITQYRAAFEKIAKLHVKLAKVKQATD